MGQLADKLVLMDDRMVVEGGTLLRVTRIGSCGGLLIVLVFKGNGI